MVTDPIVIGIDPDSQGTGVCMATAEQVLAVAVCRTGAGRRGLRAVRDQIAELRNVLMALCTAGPVAAVVSEAPQDYGEYRRKVDPNNLMLLSVVAGSAMGVAGTFVEDCFLVAPSEWKGQRKKPADHKISLAHYGWKFTDEGPGQLPTFTIPSDVAVVNEGPIPASHMKEIADAMGIARWYALKLKNKIRRTS